MLLQFHPCKENNIKHIDGKEPLVVQFDIDQDCEELVDKLEHVVLTLSLDFEKRGDLKITIKSPNGTVSDILE